MKARDHELPRWDKFEQDGHEFVRVQQGLWRCTRCGAIKDVQNSTGLPDDSWAELFVGNRVFSELNDFEDCNEAYMLAVMFS